MTCELEKHTDFADFRYTVEADGTARVARCVAHGAQVVVPEQLDGHPLIALDDECFASAERRSWPSAACNRELERVILPEGLSRIGRATFRGCNRLTHVELPSTLESIDDLAFSCTSIHSIRLSKACVRLSELALRTGPESLAGPSSPYYSKLDAIEVEAGNPTYCTSGGALCRRASTGELEAILCPGKADELHLEREVARILPTAFAGTYEIGVLRFRESLTFVDGCGIATKATCDSVEIELDESAGALSELELAMPSKELQGCIFESTAKREAFDLLAFLAAYDAAILEEPDRLAQAKLIAARLARPVHLDEHIRASLERVLAPALDSACIQFGARSYWKGFDDLADAGLLDEYSIPHAIEVLTTRADTCASSYLLELKRTRFGGGSWDYAL